MTTDWEPANVFEVFGDELVREILALASTEPRSAEELADHCDHSQPTVYRRLDTLAEYDLVSQERRVDPDGHHYKTYETTLREVSFTVEDGGFTVDLTLRQHPVDGE